jgi:uncharacterized protein UPF0547
MDISIHCPICRATYDVDEEVVGQSVTCECGQNFVATAEAKHTKTIALGSKLCPGCEEVVAVDTIICVDCGYNFNTGTSMGTEIQTEPEIVEDTGPGMATKLIPLIKPLIILMVVAAVGWMVYSSLTSKFFGISEESPLGTIEELDKHFAKVGLIKRPQADTLPKGFGTAGKIYRYDNKKMSQKSNGALSETAFVAVDSANQVCGVGGAFTPASKSIPGGIGSKVKGFITKYWEETGCVKDKNKMKTITHKGLTASMAWHEYITDSKNSGVHGQWREVSSNGTGLTEGKNSVFVVGERYSGESIISGGASGLSGDVKSLIKMK